LADLLLRSYAALLLRRLRTRSAQIAKGYNPLGKAAGTAMVCWRQKFFGLLLALFRSLKIHMAPKVALLSVHLNNGILQCQTRGDF
jgi:hypothetical protein